MEERAITPDEPVAEDHEILARALGPESHGITAEANTLVDRRVTLPMMDGVDSLNVRAAAVVGFYVTQ